MSTDQSFGIGDGVGYKLELHYLTVEAIILFKRYCFEDLCGTNAEFSPLCPDCISLGKCI